MLIPADHKNEEQEILARVRRGERVETYETERIRKGRGADRRLADWSLADRASRAGHRRRHR
jgi:hypothetical protein